MQQQAEEEMECFATGTFHCSYFSLPFISPRSMAPTAAAWAATSVDDDDDHHQQQQQQQQRIEGYIPSSEMVVSSAAADAEETEAQEETEGASAAGVVSAPTPMPMPPPPPPQPVPQASVMHEREEVSAPAAALPAPPMPPVATAQDELGGLPLPASAAATHHHVRQPYTIGGVLGLVRGRTAGDHGWNHQEDVNERFVSLTTTSTASGTLPLAPQQEQQRQHHRRLLGSTITLTGEVKYVQCLGCMLEERWLAVPIDAAFVVCSECGGVSVSRASNTRYPKDEVASDGAGDGIKLDNSEEQQPMRNLGCTQRLCARLWRSMD
jgi:hypothetical protein